MRIGAEASLLDLVVGAHRLTDANPRIRADHITVHPGYDPFTLENDLALIRLSQPVTQTPISLYDLPEGSSEMSFVRATATGWGVHVADFTAPAPDALHEVSIPLVPLETCKAAYGSWLVTDKMICAGYQKLVKGACYGDSGGPLMVQDGNGQWLQIGIVSWGPPGCVAFGQYDVFTRVSQFTDWIDTCIANIDDLRCSGGDLFEPDDTAATAKPFGPLGESQIHTFHTSGDQDWVSFEAVAGSHYWIRTATELTTTMLTSTTIVNTVMWLFDTDGHTPIAYNDGGGSDWNPVPPPIAADDDSPSDNIPTFAVPVTDSSIDWKAEKSGTYYVSVEDLAWSNGNPIYGAAAHYQLTIAEFQYHVFIPEIQSADIRSDRWEIGGDIRASAGAPR